MISFFVLKRSYRIDEIVAIDEIFVDTVLAVLGGNSLTVEVFADATGVRLWTGGVWLIGPWVIFCWSAGVAFGWTSSMKETTRLLGGGTESFCTDKLIKACRLFWNEPRLTLDVISTNDKISFLVQSRKQGLILSSEVWSVRRKQGVHGVLF